MKIFYATQVSNTTLTAQGPKWLLRNDACFNIMKGLVISVLKIRPTWKFMIKVPILADVHDVENYFDLFPDRYKDNLTFLQVATPLSPIDSRFNFDFIGIKNKLIVQDVEFDVMINDESTLTKNWRVLFNSLDMDIPIISTNYFFDNIFEAPKVPDNIRYFDRQIESLFCADGVAFSCEATKREALDARDIAFRKKFLTRKIFLETIWIAGCSAAEILDRTIKPMTFPEPVFYFGNRITDSAQRYTNWDDYAAGIGKLFMDKSIDVASYDAIMLDPTKKVTQQQKNEINALSKFKVLFEHFSRPEYIRFIRGQHISCNLFINERYGGNTCAEAMLAGNLVIMPKVHNYKDRMSKVFDYPLWVKHNGSKIDRNDLAKKMKLALQMCKTGEDKKWRSLLKTIARKDTYEGTASVLIKDINAIVKMKHKGLI